MASHDHSGRDPRMKATKNAETTKKADKTKKPSSTDVLNIGGDLVPPLDAVTLELLESGKRERVMILAGTESGAKRKAYAITQVSIDFEDEDKLRQCVRMLRWSDDRLRARPEQMLLWEWNRSFRDGMTIQFGVAWYDREFFERRKDAFKEAGHIAYYAQF